MQTDTLQIKAGCVPCGRCVPVCPEKALVITASNRPVAVTAACTGCGWCLTSCPVNLLSLVPLPVPEPMVAFQEALEHFGEPTVYSVVPAEPPAAPPKVSKPKRVRK